GSVRAQNNCVDDITGRVNQCTANDVRIASATLTDNPLPICAPGQTIVVNVRWELVAGASERYDIGLYVAKDGGAARTGQCNLDYLPAPLAPSVGTCAPGTVVPDGGPYYHGECTGGNATPTDQCGDLQQGVSNFRYDTVTIKCNDFNGDGSS